MNNAPQEDPLRPHTYDGIQEYDKRLPNWWLWTLYGSIVFALLYWAYYHAYSIGTDPADALAVKMAENASRAARASAGSGELNDEALGASATTRPRSPRARPRSRRSAPRATSRT